MNISNIIRAIRINGYYISIVAIAVCSLMLMTLSNRYAFLNNLTLYIARPINLSTFHIYDSLKSLREEAETITSLKTKYQSLEEEYNSLKEKYIELQSKMDDYSSIAKEQTALHHTKNMSHIAQLMNVTLNHFNHSVIFLGSKDNIKEGMSVMSNNQLVGTITHSTSNTSLVEKITDSNSYTPISIGKNHTFAIAQGNNTKILTILHAKGPIHVGDKVITMSIGNKYPYGLYIGTVSHINNDDAFIKVANNVSIGSYVSIVDFGLKTIEEAKKAIAEQGEK